MVLLAHTPQADELSFLSSRTKIGDPITAIAVFLLLIAAGLAFEYFSQHFDKRD